jgi:hypothetical protein
MITIIRVTCSKVCTVVTSRKWSTRHRLIEFLKMSLSPSPCYSHATVKYYQRILWCCGSALAVVHCLALRSKYFCPHVRECWTQLGPRPRYPFRGRSRELFGINVSTSLSFCQTVSCSRTQPSMSWRFQDRAKPSYISESPSKLNALQLIVFKRPDAANIFFLVGVTIG